MRKPRSVPSTADAMRARAIPRREMLGFCACMATMLGLGPGGGARLAQAMETRPRVPVLWLHGLECTCCSESFIRSGHPQASDIILSMISLDYDDTIMAAAGEQAEAIVEEIIRDYKGGYLLAVEGNVPLAHGGWNCIVGGRTFHSRLEEAARHARAVIAWGTCASFGCVQAARPNPTQATPISRLVSHVPVVNVPGCPPIAEVMTGILSYMLMFDRLPEVDRNLRPKIFYGQRIHDKCYRRAHFDAGQFVEAWDDEGARQGFCLYKMGCRGPTTYNACGATGWNEGLSFPIRSGHGCIGCSEDGFWDRGPFYERLPTLAQFGIESTADGIGAAALAGVGAALGGKVALTAGQGLLRRCRRTAPDADETP
ncbi:hydrogenase 1 small subunit [Rhodovastum atsumiense]|uniref:hydrogenase (acceptor) n=1 Tax=Rhodovastum atsumiense TaxID=504468 RepID=A0A5M6IWJ9_9PROT|nr:hydrogenase small subunit [Rhodovastum atsumiense]KAA5612706.1 hydrogenase small subunit [Rhodovastum atsumiense]CAH2602743.1 hydrogenase 1 small subunit [Rhodovastum atsumiense]